MGGACIVVASKKWYCRTNAYKKSLEDTCLPFNITSADEFAVHRVIAI